MDVEIDRERMLGLFLEMVRIPSLSKRERGFCDFLKPLFTDLGGVVYEDNSGESTGGNAGNLIVSFENDTDVPALILSAHMDTVSPGEGIVPVVNGNTVSSEGETVLGADDKAGIAIIVEVLKVLKAKNRLRNIEVVITAAEEIGLVGASRLEHKRLRGRYCVALDTEKSNTVINRAPALNKLTFNIRGKDAHAGMCPERGISAIQIAGEAISKMQLGRIDSETTANIGLISGGEASNIVPKNVVMVGEARSHDLDKLGKQTQSMIDCVKDVAAKYASGSDEAGFTCDVNMDFSVLNTPEESLLIRHIGDVCRKKGVDIDVGRAGGGSDANIFHSYGIESVIMGIGMKHPHSTSETLAIDEFNHTAELVLAIAENWGTEP